MDCCIRTAEIAPEIPRVKKITRITAHAVFFMMDFILFALEAGAVESAGGRTGGMGKKIYLASPRQENWFFYFLGGGLLERMAAGNP